MWETLLNNPIFLVFAFLTITGIVASLSHAWRKVKQAEIEAQLKSEMIQRGMSAEEIKKVIEASSARAVRRALAEHPEEEARPISR